MLFYKRHLIYFKYKPQCRGEIVETIEEDYCYDKVEQVETQDIINISDRYILYTVDKEFDKTKALKVSAEGGFLGGILKLKFRCRFDKIGYIERTYEDKVSNTIEDCCLSPRPKFIVAHDNICECNGEKAFVSIGESIHDIQLKEIEGDRQHVIIHNVLNNLDQTIDIFWKVSDIEELSSKNVVELNGYITSEYLKEKESKSK